MALLAIVGIGAAGALRGTPDADRTVASIAVFPLLALLGAAAAAAVVTTVLSRRRLMPDPEDEDEEDDASRSRWLRLALLLLPVAVVGALIVAIAVRPAAKAPTHQQVQSTRPLPPVGSNGGGNPWELVAFAGGAIAMTAFLGYGIWKVRPRRPGGLAARRPPAPDPSAAVDDALAALDAERDPRRAIINAYVRMERALDDAGIGRRESEAPREYLARVAGALRGDDRAARRLTALYEEARFSAHAVDEAMRAEAISALRALRAEGAA